MKFGIRVATGAMLTAMAATAAHADGDPARGRVVFNQCMACHSLNAGQNGVGPSLHGLIGRKAGTAPNFAYSPFMKRSGIVWDEASLKSYLPDPQAKVPGTKMTFIGLKDPQQVEDVVAYLKQAAK